LRYTKDGYYTFVVKHDGYWTVGASHKDVAGEIGQVEHIDCCCPSDLPRARRRVLYRARKVK
jgi:hypothetical protein